MQNNNIIQLNKGQQDALEIILSGVNACILGTAGTGKTEVIMQACRQLKNQGKRVETVSFQGIAAQAIKGRTMHSAFRLPFNLKLFFPEYKNIEFIYNADVLIIEEIGMINKQMMDVIGACIELCGKKKQIVAVGDFYQIEPIHFHTPAEFAFESHYWEKFNFRICELTDIVRQDNRDFIKNLNLIRVGERKALDYFVANMNKEWIEDAIAICTHKRLVKMINDKKVAALKEKEFKEYSASYVGEIVEDELPGEKCLIIKRGMRVMTTVNSSMGYQNGSMGEVVGYDDNSVSVRFDHDGVVRKICWVTTEMPRVDKTAKEGELTTVTFMPLRLAYAITIHKSQGQTFEKVNIVIGPRGTFAHGQLYVALSRCRQIENLHIVGNIYSCNITPNPKVENFYKRIYSTNKSEPKRTEKLLRYEKGRVLYV